MACSWSSQTQTSKSPGGPVETDILGPTQVSDSISREWEPRICISNKFLEDADAVGLRTAFFKLWQSGTNREMHKCRRKKGSNQPGWRGGWRGSAKIPGEINTLLEGWVEASFLSGS